MSFDTRGQLDLSNSKVVAELVTFLEAIPPNSPVVIRGVRTTFSPASGVHQIAEGCPSRLQLHCHVDDGIRRFEGALDNAVRVGFRFLEYSCRDCGEYTKTFALAVEFESVGDDGANGAAIRVMKLGEYPPFGAPIARRIQRLLDKEDLELYRKGCRAEAQGLGIGAATYFRRIVESRWKLLIKELRRAAERLGHDQLEVFDAALGETQFARAVRMLRDAIPSKLLILDGENPLTLLYAPLSVQLHEVTDGQCLQQAADIRTVLTALLENIGEVLRDQDELKSAVGRLRMIRRPE